MRSTCEGHRSRDLEAIIFYFLHHYTNHGRIEAPISHGAVAAAAVEELEHPHAPRDHRQVRNPRARGLRRVLRRLQGPPPLRLRHRRPEGGARLPVGLPRDRGPPDPPELPQRRPTPRVLLERRRGRRSGARVPPHRPRRRRQGRQEGVGRRDHPRRGQALDGADFARGGRLPPQFDCS